MYSIAIDGPAGSGKGTVAKGLANKLNFLYVDTGAMYRATGLYFIKNNISLDDEKSINDNLDKIDIKLKYKDNKTTVYLNQKDVSLEIRTEECSRAASKVGVYEKVRENLVRMQKEYAKTNNIVMEGRDIGTVVLPNANLKIYLTASCEERARRRYIEQKEKGLELTYEEVLKDIKERDYRDMHREISPLKQADDAILVDSTDMTIDEVINEILKYRKVRD